MKSRKTLELLLPLYGTEEYLGRSEKRASADTDPACPKKDMRRCLIRQFEAKSLHAIVDANVPEAVRAGRDRCADSTLLNPSLILMTLNPSILDQL